MWRHTNNSTCTSHFKSSFSLGLEVPNPRVRALVEETPEKMQVLVLILVITCVVMVSVNGFRPARMSSFVRTGNQIRALRMEAESGATAAPLRLLPLSRRFGKAKAVEKADGEDVVEMSAEIKLMRVRPRGVSQSTTSSSVPRMVERRMGSRWLYDYSSRHSCWQSYLRRRR